MIGCAQAGIEDQVELCPVGRRLLQEVHRLPRQQQLDGAQALVALGRGGNKGMVHSTNIGERAIECK